MRHPDAASERRFMESRHRPSLRSVLERVIRLR